MPALQTKQHVYLDDNGVPRVGAPGMKVIDLVVAHQAHGYSAAELHFQFRDISMSEAHAALAYYWDNKPQLDAAIEEQDRYVRELRAELGESPAIKRLRKLGYIE